MKNILLMLKELISLPKKSRLDIARKNIKILSIYLSIFLAVGIGMIIFNLEFRETRSEYYYYYISLVVVSIIGLLQLFVAKRSSNYYLIQSAVIIVISLLMSVFIFDLADSGVHFSNLIIFYMSCTALIISFNITPFYHLFYIVIYCILLIFIPKKMDISVADVVNHYIYCGIFIILAFYKRKLRVINERQKYEISKKNRLLKVNNYYLNNKRRDLMFDKKFLEDKLFSTEQELAFRNEQMLAFQDNTIIGLANLVETRDEDTGEHVRRTRDYVELIATKAYVSGDFPELTDELVSLYIKAAPMHDIGKIAISDNLLKKRGKLSDLEFRQMRKHAAKGGEIIENILGHSPDKLYIQTAKEIAIHHHERIDGTGYPDRLTGENIPLGARIMAIADVFDALVSKRCYKPAMSLEDAFSEIKKNSGTQFDPVLVKIFIDSKDEVIEIYNKYTG